jgi:FKBP-type peptidyl-prolyl cis-trans isomerase SlyD
MIGPNAVVSMHYTLTNDAGEVLDSSQGQDPLVYLHGVGNIIPGLEDALAGKTSGAKVKASIAPEDGYGIRQEEMIQAIPRDMFSAEDIQPGMVFQAEGHMLTVVSVTDAEVTVDGNHPLAGQTLHFDVEIVEVRDATAEELEHGHVHGAGGHHH